MSAEKQLYLETGHKLQDAVQSQLFGKPCFKINGKAFICFFENCMVFKLSGDTHAEALGLPGSILFDPSHKKRPMKEWVQVPYARAANWERYAGSAIANVASGK